MELAFDQLFFLDVRKSDCLVYIENILWASKFTRTLVKFYRYLLHGHSLDDGIQPSNRMVNMGANRKRKTADNQFLFDFGFNPFPNKPWFLRVCSTAF